MITLFDYETVMKNYEKEMFEKGREEGREEGQKVTAIDTAKRMLSESFPVDVAARISGLSLTEVNALKAQLTQ